MIHDEIGDQLKEYEQQFALRVDAGKPLVMRLDGRAFHTFTKGLKRPFDKRLSTLMADTTKYLVEMFHAKLGYTQSDEISLLWLPPADTGQQYLFDGKVQKLVSVIASATTGYFASHLSMFISERDPLDKRNGIPSFDARVLQPNDSEILAYFKWRRDDAIKNSISMLAQAHFSHKSLEFVGSTEKKKMLEEIGVSWYEQPDFFKSGVFFSKTTKKVELTEEQLLKIPEKYRPTGPVDRSVIVESSWDEVKLALEPRWQRWQTNCGTIA